MVAWLVAFSLSLVAQDEKPAPSPEKPAQEKPEVPSEAPPQAPPPPLFVFHEELRMGGWQVGSFDATTSGGRREIDSAFLFDAGLDLHAQYAGLTLTLSVDYAVGGDLRLEMVGLLAGTQVELEIGTLPVDVQISLGPVFGRLEVDEAAFGDFESAVGFEGRVDATGWLSEWLGAALWAAYRQIRFDYDGDVLAGDDSAGGGTLAVGAAFVIRF